MWENPNPSVEFAEQTITLSSDDYDILLVEVLNAISSSIHFYALGSKGYITSLDLSFYSGGMNLRHRNMTYVDDKHYSFGSALQNGSVANSFCIPFKIYGIKTSLN